MFDFEKWVFSPWVNIFMLSALNRNMLHQRIYQRDWFPVYEATTMKDHRDPESCSMRQCSTLWQHLAVSLEKSLAFLRHSCSRSTDTLEVNFNYINGYSACIFYFTLHNILKLVLPCLRPHWILLVYFSSRFVSKDIYFLFPFQGFQILPWILIFNPVQFMGYLLPREFFYESLYRPFEHYVVQALSIPCSPTQLVYRCL
jgi:hypothetical protein